MYKRFHMTTLHSIHLLDPGVWMTTLDLKDAYFYITIIPSHRKYLRFTVGDNHYQFKSLPFGISSAPRVFTKNRGSLTLPGTSNIPLPGRLAASGGLRESSARSYTNNALSTSSPQDLHEPRQVPVEIFPVRTVYRGKTGPHLCKGFPAVGSCGHDCCTRTMPDYISPHRSASATTFGPHGLHGLYGTDGQDVYAPPPTVFRKAIQTTFAFSNEADIATPCGEKLASVVDDGGQLVSGKALLASSSIQDPDDGRVPHRMGGSPRWTDGPRPMGRRHPHATSTHQQIGTAHHLSSLPILCFSPQRAFCCDNVGQYHDRLLHQSSGQDGFPLPLQTCPPTLEFLPREQHYTDSDTRSGCQQLTGRCLEPRPDSLPQTGTQRLLLKLNLPSQGISNPGCLCICDQYKVQPLSLQRGT